MANTDEADCNYSQDQGRAMSGGVPSAETTPGRQADEADGDHHMTRLYQEIRTARQGGQEEQHTVPWRGEIPNIPGQGRTTSVDIPHYRDSTAKTNRQG